MPEAGNGSNLAHPTGCRGIPTSSVRAYSRCRYRMPPGILGHVHTRALSREILTVPESASLDLAVIGNCQVSALIDREGRIVWACWPRPDADPIFCALLGPTARDTARGSLAYRTPRSYGIAAVLYPQYRHRHDTADRRGGRRNSDHRLLSSFPQSGPDLQTRGPDSHRRARQGRPFIRVRLHPRLNDGATEPTMTTGSHHVRFVGDGIAFRVTTDASLTFLALDQPFRWTGATPCCSGPTRRSTSSSVRSRLTGWWRPGSTGRIGCEPWRCRLSGSRRSSVRPSR